MTVKIAGLEWFDGSDESLDQLARKARQDEDGEGGSLFDDADDGE